MQMHELVDKARKFALTVLSSNATSWTSKFMIGAGTEAMIGRVEPFIRTTGTVGENGDVDIDRLHDIVMTGFNNAGHVDVFNGMLGFDPQDAEDLFAYIKS